MVQQYGASVGISSSCDIFDFDRHQVEVILEQYPIPPTMLNDDIWLDIRVESARRHRSLQNTIVTRSRRHWRGSEGRYRTVIGT